MYNLLAKEELVPNIHLIKVMAPAVAKKAKPGQFVIVTVDEKGERIPLTIADWDGEEGSITIVFMEVGTTTQRMAQLREKAHRVRNGHVGRIEEIQHLLNKMPPEARNRASRELAARYSELKLDLRLERLDRAVAAYEKRIRDLTRLAENYLAAKDYKKLHDVLEGAEKLQTHNTNLLKIIERTEKKLLAAAQNVAGNAGGVSGA